MKKYSIGLVLIMALFLWGCGEEEQASTMEEKSQPVSQKLDISNPTIYTQLEEEKNFQSFVSMVKKARLEYWLNEEENITVFVPTNAAIAPLLQDKKIMSRIIAEPDFIIDLVKNHIVPKARSYAQLKTTDKVYNTNEQAILVTQVGDQVFLNNTVEVSRKPVKAENGYIYSVNQVLMPE